MSRNSFPFNLYTVWFEETSHHPFTPSELRNNCTIISRTNLHGFSRNTAHPSSLPACERSARRASYLDSKQREGGRERERERERESLLNAPSCKRNTYRYETNDTTTLINSDECVYNIGFVISRVHIRFRARINIRRAALAGPVAALLRAYKFK